MADTTPEGKDNEPRVYVAQSYVVDKFRPPSYWDMGVFSTYEEACDYLRTLEGDIDGNSTRYEIRSFVLGDRDPSEREKWWFFDRMLNLLESSDHPFREWNEHVEEDGLRHDNHGEWCSLEEAQPARFAVGDIVLLKEMPRTEFTAGAADRIAVVAEVPGPFMRHDDKVYDKIPEQPPEGAELLWSKIYLVYYISPHGNIWHEHPWEDELEEYTAPLPEHLSFLCTLSDHLTHKRRIREESLGELFNDRLIVKNFRIFSEDDLEPLSENENHD